MPYGLGVTTAANPANTRTTSQSYPQWEYDLLRNLGGNPAQLPVSLKVLNIWARIEGVTTAAHNWLAVSNGTNNVYELPDSNGDLSGNPDFIATFPSTDAGVQGITAFLRNGYPKLVAALIDPNSSVTDITAQIPTNAWGGDAAAINATYGYNVPTYYGGEASGPHGTAAGQGSPTFSGCNSANVLIGGGGLGFKFNLLNACQAKALVGGFVVAIGGLIFAGSLIGLGATQFIKANSQDVDFAGGLFTAKVLGKKKSEKKPDAGDLQYEQWKKSGGYTKAQKQRAEEPFTYEEKGRPNTAATRRAKK